MQLFLARLTVKAGGNPNRPRPGRQWIGNPYRVHQRLCMAFPDSPSAAESHTRDGKHSVLFRIEDGPIRRILVQSSREPNWNAAFEKADFLLAAPPETKRLDLKLKQGQRFRFLLRANPTVKISKTKKRVGIKDEAGQRAWLERKAQNSGFSVENDTLRLIPRGDQVSRRSRMKDKNTHVHHAVDFTGYLTVADSDRFEHALLSGIGSAKAYGFGLLSLAPA